MKSLRTLINKNNLKYFTNYDSYESLFIPGLVVRISDDGYEYDNIIMDLRNKFFDKYRKEFVKNEDGYVLISLDRNHYGFNFFKSNSFKKDFPYHEFDKKTFIVSIQDIGIPLKKIKTIEDLKKVFYDYNLNPEL